MVQWSLQVNAFYWPLTIVAGQTPAGGNAGRSRGKGVGGLSQAHGANMGAHAHRGGQLDESNVVVDGAGVPLGVGEDLKREVMQGLQLSCFINMINPTFSVQ